MLSVEDLMRSASEMADRTITLKDMDGLRRDRALLRMLQRADKDLGARLDRINNLGGRALSSFQIAQMVAYQTQIRLVTKHVQARLRGHVFGASNRAVSLSLRRMMTLTRQVDHIYTGVVRPLRLMEAAQMDRVIKGSKASLLAQHEASVDRYGQATIKQMERIMQNGLIAGTANRDMAAKLQRFTPNKFWATRIVRTECASAYNGAAFDGMAEMERDDPETKKKILAVMDKRTAPDSVAVHGQIRKMADKFMDGAGRQYLKPPARPNDREHIIPWYPDWRDDDYTRPRPPEEVAEAVRRSQPKSRQPKGAERQMQDRTVRGAQRLEKSGKGA